QPVKPTNPDQGEQEEFNQVNLVRDALQHVLDDREREILRVWFFWYDPTRANQCLPDDVVQDLAERFDTTPENVRQVRRRALKKLEAQLTDDLGQSPADK